MIIQLRGRPHREDYRRRRTTLETEKRFTSIPGWFFSSAQTHKCLLVYLNVFRREIVEWNEHGRI